MSSETKSEIISVPVKSLLNLVRVKNFLYFNPTEIEDEFGDITNIKTILESKPINLSIHPKQEEIQFKTELHAQISKNIIDNVSDTDKFCDGINDAYIEQSIIDSDAVLVIETTRDKILYGFATLKFIISKNTLYIDLICTNTDVKGVGTHILKLIDEICKITSINNITLKSVTSAVTFYLKNNFVCQGQCNLKKKLTFNEEGKGIRQKRTKRKTQNRKMKMKMKNRKTQKRKSKK
jgi:hypothetical protein